MQSTESQAGIILQQHVGEVDFPIILGLVPWGHHVQIISNCKSIDEALFYHIPLNCYVVAELKAVPFQPEFAGKLNFYVNAVDDLIKTPSQNPTIGLLICKNKDETDVQYAFSGITTPMGVASYDNVRIREIQRQLPTIEQLKERIRLLEVELRKKQ